MPHDAAAAEGSGGIAALIQNATFDRRLTARSISVVSCSSLRRLSDAPVRSHMLSSGRSASKAYFGSSWEKGMPVHGPHALHA